MERFRSSIGGIRKLTAQGRRGRPQEIAGEEDVEAGVLPGGDGSNQGYKMDASGRLLDIFCRLIRSRR